MDDSHNKGFEKWRQYFTFNIADESHSNVDIRICSFAGSFKITHFKRMCRIF